VGTGSYEEALAWVEYCNGKGNTQWVMRLQWLSPGTNDSWANLRRKNTGRDEPHNVKYWGLGNEGG
jgi:alpha-N-arabinofuranosidase